MYVIHNIFILKCNTNKWSEVLL